MTAHDSKSYLPYLNKLLDEYNNTYHHSINKNLIYADYSALTGSIESNPKVSKFKVNDRMRISNNKNIFSKGYTDSVLKTNPWRYKIKHLNWEKITRSFYEKELLQSIL